MEKSEITVLIIGIILFIGGLTIRYTINRRRFNRRGVGGLQHFKNYEHATLLTFIEKVGKLLSGIMLLAGIFFIAVAICNSAL